MERKKITKRFWITLVSAPILVLLFALFVLPPLYEVLCDITGFNGKTGRVETEKAYVVDEERLVGVSFFSATSPGFPVLRIHAPLQCVPGSLSVELGLATLDYGL